MVEAWCRPGSAALAGNQLSTREPVWTGNPVRAENGCGPKSRCGGESRRGPKSPAPIGNQRRSETSADQQTLHRMETCTGWKNLHPWERPTRSGKPCTEGKTRHRTENPAPTNNPAPDEKPVPTKNRVHGPGPENPARTRNRANVHAVGGRSGAVFMSPSAGSQRGPGGGGAVGGACPLWTLVVRSPGGRASWPGPGAGAHAFLGSPAAGSRQLWCRSGCAPPAGDHVDGPLPPGSLTAPVAGLFRELARSSPARAQRQCRH